MTRRICPVAPEPPEGHHSGAKTLRWSVCPQVGLLIPLADPSKCSIACALHTTMPHDRQECSSALVKARGVAQPVGSVLLWMLPSCTPGDRRPELSKDLTTTSDDMNFARRAFVGAIIRSRQGPHPSASCLGDPGDRVSARRHCRSSLLRRFPSWLRAALSRVDSDWQSGLRVGWTNPMTAPAVQHARSRRGLRGPLRLQRRQRL